MAVENGRQERRKHDSPSVMAAEELGHVLPTLPAWFQLPNVYKKRPKTQRAWPSRETGASLAEGGLDVAELAAPAERPFSGR